MNDVNTVVIGGRLVRDPDVNETNSGKAVCNIVIASNKISGETSYATFIKCVFFGKLAEAVNNYRGKGDNVIVTGSLSYSTWETKEGDKRQEVYILGDSCIFGNKAKDRDEEE